MTGGDGGGHVVVAPDKFKGSLTAAEAAQRITDGLRRVAPGCTVHVAAVADGGDGLLDAMLGAGFERRTATVPGPTGEPVEAAFAVRDRTAVVELAEASGLRRLPGALAALDASSLGTGRLVVAALDAGCTEIVLGIGGSACTDGGAGLLIGLGARVLDAAGAPVSPGGGGLAAAATLDLAGLDARLADVRLVLACDVDNPLLGPHGAAAVYAPQKGAEPHDVEVLEANLTRWAELVQTVTGRDAAGLPGAGAAGGVGFAALAVLGALARPGIELVLDLTGFHDLLAGARLVVTGEGSLDAQSLHGKTPVGVAAAAARKGVPTVAVAGRSTIDAEAARGAGFAAVHALTDIEPDVERCIAFAGDLLEELVATRVATPWLVEG